MTYDIIIIIITYISRRTYDENFISIRQVVAEKKTKVRCGQTDKRPKCNALSCGVGNKEVMFMCDLTIQSSVNMENKALRLDIVLRHKKEKKALLMEGSVSSDFGLNTQIKKMTKYPDFKNEVKRSWKLKLNQ